MTEQAISPLRRRMIEDMRTTIPPPHWPRSGWTPHDHHARPAMPERSLPSCLVLDRPRRHSRNVQDDVTVVTT